MAIATTSTPDLELDDVEKTIAQLPLPISDEAANQLRSQLVVCDYRRQKLEKEACRNWDKFYGRNADHFFKDRNWGNEDLTIELERCGFLNETNASRPLRFVELGSGCGNMLFPLARDNPHWTFLATDFSQKAITLLSDRAEKSGLDVWTAVNDLTLNEGLTLPDQPADVGTLIFVLSAVHPDKQATVARSCARFIKPGGVLLVRDYAAGDHAMIRFGRRNAKLSERFYARQDGTRAYYFMLDELVTCFTSTGLWKSSGSAEYLARRTQNRQKGLDVARHFLQAVFIRTVDAEQEEDKNTSSSV